MKLNAQHSKQEQVTISIVNITIIRNQHKIKSKYILYNCNHNLTFDKVANNHTGDTPSITPNRERETAVYEAFLVRSVI